LTILAELQFKGKTPCFKMVKISHVKSKSFDGSENVIIPFGYSIGHFMFEIISNWDNLAFEKSDKIA
jgi:hypothetical protein